MLKEAPQPWRDPYPNFKWPITVQHLVETGGELVWKAISTSSNLEFGHPFCARNPVQVWPGSDSRDEVHYLNGLIYERRFCAWYDGIGYDLHIGKKNEKYSFVTWRIKPVNEHKCLLRITVYPCILQNLPVFIRWLPYQLLVTPMLKKYLSAVIRGFKWYVIRGEPVPRNQFGVHPWFSVASSDLVKH